MRKKGFWFFVLGIAFFCGLGYVLFFSSLLRLVNVEILPVGAVDEQEIKAVAQAELSRGFLGDSFFFFNSNQAGQKLLKTFPEIKKAQVKKRLQKIIVLVERRSPAFIACFQTKENCFLVDTDLIIFEKYLLAQQAEPLLMPVVLVLDESKSFSEQAFLKDIWVKIEEIISFFEGELNIKIAEFELENERFLKVKTEQGWYGYFDLQNDLKITLVKLRLVLEKEISSEKQKTLEYIDLRFSKTYYKYK